jgi:hypothetical protein
VTREEQLAFLAGRVVSRTGKLLKTKLREQFKGYTAARSLTAR